MILLKIINASIVLQSVEFSMLNLAWKITYPFVSPNKPETYSN